MSAPAITRSESTIAILFALAFGVFVGLAISTCIGCGPRGSTPADVSAAHWQACEARMLTVESEAERVALVARCEDGGVP